MIYVDSACITSPHIARAETFPGLHEDLILTDDVNSLRGGPGVRSLTFAAGQFYQH